MTGGLPDNNDEDEKFDQLPPMHLQRDNSNKMASSISPYTFLCPSTADQKFNPYVNSTPLGRFPLFF